MKKLFTLICALVGFAAYVNAATVDDLAVCKHSYVFVADDYTSNGTVKTTKGSLIADNFVYCVTGNSVATNKQNINLAETDESGAYVWLNGKYAEYGQHLNSLRLKNAQDVVAMKVTQGSKIIVLGQAHSSRYATFNTQADLKGTTYGDGAANSKIATFTAPDDMTIYIGSQGGDYYISYIIVEANEPEGTPSVKVGAQTQDGNGRWYRDITCTSAKTSDGSNTVVTYTTDGSTPTASSSVYEEPVRCYKNQTVKFQAYMDLGDGVAYDDAILQGAENEGIASFSFDAPTINDDGNGNVTIVSPYTNAVNHYQANSGAEQEGSTFTLTESATVTAYSTIDNGENITFTSKSTSKDVYVLNPIKAEMNIAVTSYEIKDSIDATTNAPVYWIENGVISADKSYFFVKNLTFSAISNADATNAKYQVPAGQEAYIQMSNTNISFSVAEGDSVDVTVTLTKNSCKTLNASNDETVTSDRKIYVNVDGTTYGYDDITNGDVDNLDGYQNVIKFGVGAGIHTFLKYSGTGNIHVSSFNFKPADKVDGIENVAVASASKTVKAIENGQLVIKSAKGTFTAAGARIK